MAELKRFPYAPGVAEAFSFLNPLFEADPTIAADFVGRIPGVATSTDKDTALEKLAHFHVNTALQLGFEDTYHAQQVHGCELAIINEESPLDSQGVDGLLTKTPGVLLGIHVADCGALYLVDQKTKAVALLHSGKKGTELNITARAVKTMEAEFGTHPADLIAVLAPCIRPPHYEIDFATTIAEQALAVGISEEHYHDCGICTSNLEQFYSYRLEKGDTGRMLALLGHLD